MNKSAYMAFEKVEAYVDAFHHIQEIVLEDERFSGMVEHPSRMFEFLEIFEMSANFFRMSKERVLYSVRQSDDD